jgi:hypothetical protein
MPFAHSNAHPGKLRLNLPKHVNPASREILLCEFPVHQIAEGGFDELWAQVAVVDVVGVFPDGDAQERLVAGGERSAGSAVLPAPSFLYFVQCCVMAKSAC